MTPPMNTPIWIGVTLGWLLGITGCTSTHLLLQESPPRFYEHLNKTGKGQTGEIHFLHGAPVVGQRIHVTPDSTVWSDPTTDQAHRIATAEIDAIVIKDRMRGGMDGALVGASVGALLGSNRQTRVWEGLAQGHPAGLVIPGVIGSGIIGWAVGVTRGHRERFVFTKQE